MISLIECVWFIEWPNFSFLTFSIEPPLNNANSKNEEKKSVRQSADTKKFAPQKKRKKEKSQAQADELNANFSDKYFLVFVTNYH